MKTVAAIAAVLALSACATGGGAACTTGSQAGSTAELYFGRNIGDQPGVSEADWRAFLDEEVTPRFPDGLTVIDAAGQWRSQSGAIGREASKVLVIVLSGRSDERARLDAIREAYKRRFRQEAVMLVERAACVAF
ncbi:DUF3574 domain-containing protein [Brevundimonas sp. BR2-1]|uniref:DUF3574 domain-containing protein n=1 Tax=Brevundimonas sp. BR2-1 TaxID=3031123 RepID=UPI0030A96A22